MPPDAREVVAAAGRALADRNPELRPVPTENLHMTVSFVGSVEDERVPPLGHALHRAVVEVPAGAAALAGVGAFPGARRARVVWVGLDDLDGAIGRADAAVRAALADHGFPPEDRPLHPHVTVGRLRTPARVDLAGIDVEAVRVPVDALTLVQSRLGGPHARYQILAELPLAG